MNVIKISEIIRLRTLGYTKEEVAAFMEAEKGEATIETIEGEPVPEEIPEETPPETAEQPNVTELLNTIKELTAALQIKNVKESEQPAAEPAETTDDIIRKMIG